jgi:flagellar hook-basal body complex protein FliE
MPNPIDPSGVPIRPSAPEKLAGEMRSRTVQGGEQDFREVLLNSLDQVNSLQQEATAEVEGLVRGDTQNVAEVFSAVRKAEVAFGLLMEIRNKLTDAYQEIQQIRF